MSGECPVCGQKMKIMSGITNEHITGDEKDLFVKKCSHCGSYYLFVFIEAKLSSGENIFSFRIDLEESEAKNLLDVMEKCPEKAYKRCTCPAHKILDQFDYSNKDRRVILKDEMDYW